MHGDDGRARRPRREQRPGQRVVVHDVDVEPLQDARRDRPCAAPRAWLPEPCAGRLVVGARRSGRHGVPGSPAPIRVTSWPRSTRPSTRSAHDVLDAAVAQGRHREPGRRDHRDVQGRASASRRERRRVMAPPVAQIPGRTFRRIGGSETVRETSCRRRQPGGPTSRARERPSRSSRRRRPAEPVDLQSADRRRDGGCQPDPVGDARVETGAGCAAAAGASPPPRPAASTTSDTGPAPRTRSRSKPQNSSGSRPPKRLGRVEQAASRSAAPPRRTRSASARPRSGRCRAATPTRCGSSSGCRRAIDEASVRTPQPVNISGRQQVLGHLRGLVLVDDPGPQAVARCSRPGCRSAACRGRGRSRTSRGRAARTSRLNATPSAAARAAQCSAVPVVAGPLGDLGAARRRRRRRSPAPRPARSGRAAIRPSANVTPSKESFHPWLQQAAVGCALVLDVPVAVPVAVPLDPVQRAVGSGQ